jgi:hypothetical protein
MHALGPAWNARAAKPHSQEWLWYQNLPGIEFFGNLAILRYKPTPGVRYNVDS